MATSFTVAHKDVDATADIHPPNAVVSDASSRGADMTQEPCRLPDVSNVEWQREGMPDTDFNRRYPPDAWGEEAGPNGRVWKIYRDRQTVSDNGMLEGWNKTLDVMLIFAGLFSAVLTAFLIESYKSLQPDYTQYVAAFLYSAAVSNNRTGGVFPSMDTLVAPDSFVQTSSAQRWTNGLWFSSLVISLTVALLCILIKQWLDAYDSHVSSAAPSPHRWARRHSLYHHGLKKWGVPVLISFLPLLLHLSLFLFFVGLILFLRPLDDAISYSLLVMVLCIGAFYLLSLVLPAWRVECPSYTPLLTHALLAVSRPISGLQYVTDRLYSWAWRLCYVRSAMPLPALAKKMEQWLGSIHLRATHQLARETHAISTCEQDLDGYVLRALIDLPTDTNLDVVNAACVALGAVTSTCTMEVISRNRPDDLCLYKIRECYCGIPSTSAGFATTSQAQLLHAYHVMSLQNGSSPFLWYLGGLQPDPSLGIDGLLLSILGDPEDTRNCHYMDLIPQLKSLPLTDDSSPGFPLRSLCLTFMSHYAYHWRVDLDSPSLSSFLLVFCAGRFATAERHELVRALRSLETVLGRRCSITLPAHNREERDYIRAVVNGLWLMLVDPERHHVDTVTAQMVAYTAYKVYPRDTDQWVDLPGLSAFCRSPTFGQCVSTSDRLAEYTKLIDYPTLAQCSEAEVGEYWLCVASVLKLRWDYAPQTDELGRYPAREDGILQIGHFQRETPPRIQRGPYATLDDWHEPILRAFLDGPNAIATWTGANSPDHDDKCVIELADLACRISIVLRRRQRLGRVDDAFIRGFFSGTFLLGRFKDLISRVHLYRAKYGRNLHVILMVLAEHCLQLSQERFIEVCTQLEEAGDADSELRRRAIAFAQTLCGGSMPRGELSQRCSRYCPCMIGPGRPLDTREWTRIWTNIAGRFRLGGNASVTSQNV